MIMYNHFLKDSDLVNYAEDMIPHSLVQKLHNVKLKGVKVHHLSF